MAVTSPLPTTPHKGDGTSVPSEAAAPRPATWLADRAILRVSGTETPEFLQGLLTQDIVGAVQAGTGAPVWAGLLSPQGKVLFDLLVWPAPDGRDGEAVLLDVEAARAEVLLKKLTLYRLRRALTIARDDRLAVHWAPQVAPQIAQKGGDRSAGAVSPVAEDWVGGGTRPFVDPRLPALGSRWLAPMGAGPTAASTDASADAVWRAHRLSLGVTEGVAELVENQTLWLEANARELNGVSFTKGCYVGQENTARMHHRGKVNRRLVVVPDALDAGRAAVACYPELGCKVVLARRDDPAWALLPDWARSDK